MSVREPIRAAAVVVSTLLLLAIAGCDGAGDDEPPAPDVVDVSPALEVPVDDDVQAPPRSEGGLSGVMPGDFPEDLPLYLPASLVDFGTTQGGRRYVELLTTASRADVSSRLDQQLARAGWRVSGHGAERRLERGGRVVVLRLDDGGVGTLYRYEY